MTERDEISERCGSEGHPRYKGDVRCYCGARDYPPESAPSTEPSTTPDTAACVLWFVPWADARDLSYPTTEATT